MPKYIAYKDSCDGKEYMITFPGDRNQPQHRDIANAMGFEKDDILGAGQYIDVGGRIVFSGESFTLDIKSRGDIDKELYIEQGRK